MLSVSGMEKWITGTKNQTWLLHDLNLPFRAQVYQDQSLWETSQIDLYFDVGMPWVHEYVSQEETVLSHCDDETLTVTCELLKDDCSICWVGCSCKHLSTWV